MIKNWDEHQEKRRIPESHKMVSCYAAFNHLRLNRWGAIHPCCFSDKRQDWKKGENSLKNYWFEGLNKQYQKSFLNNDLHPGCLICKNRVEANDLSPIIEYDQNMGDDRLEHALNPNSWPKIVEFEISNLCNLECEMCHAGLSSKLYMGRDKDIIHTRPDVYDLPNVYDNDENLNSLIEEFKEFIPHLREIRFVGGEPFAHKGMFKIAKVIADLNRNCSLQVCTNGTVYNKKVEEICKNNNLRLTISIDSVLEEEYKQIRIGAKYQDTYNNIQKLKGVLGSDKITVNATFMSVNAENIDQFFLYAIENNFRTFVNVYIREWREHTKDWSLYNLSRDAKDTSIEKLKAILNQLDLLNETHKSHNTEIKKVISLLET